MKETGGTFQGVVCALTVFYLQFFYMHNQSNPHEMVIKAQATKHWPHHIVSPEAAQEKYDGGIV